jgi:plastocyanin
MRMRKHIAAIPVLTGLLFFAAVPALADQSVKTQGGDVYPAFSPTSITVMPGEKLTFTNADSGTHNVAWDDNGVPPTPSSPSSVWTTTPSRTFTVPGVYRFYCQMHGGTNGFGMSGKVTVLQQNGQPPPTTSPPDRTAPSIAGLSASAGRKRFTLKFSSSEKGSASGKLERKNSHGVYKTFGAVSFSVKKSSSNSITIKQTSAGRTLTTGKFRVSFRVKDTAGNNSSKKSATVTIAR